MLLFNIQMSKVRLGSPYSSKLLQPKDPPTHTCECLIHKVFEFYFNELKPKLQLEDANHQDKIKEEYYLTIKCPG
jgi:hypothetical protein